MKISEYKNKFSGNETFDTIAYGKDLSNKFCLWLYRYQHMFILRLGSYPLGAIESWWKSLLHYNTDTNFGKVGVSFDGVSFDKVGVWSRFHFTQNEVRVFEGITEKELYDIMRRTMPSCEFMWSTHEY